MKRTFLVELDTEGEDPSDVAEDISETLSQFWLVHSVKPWSTHQSAKLLSSFVKPNASQIASTTNKVQTPNT